VLGSDDGRQRDRCVRNTEKRRNSRKAYCGKFSGRHMESSFRRSRQYPRAPPPTGSSWDTTRLSDLRANGTALECKDAGKVCQAVCKDLSSDNAF
jgi:hypothetical protein